MLWASEATILRKVDALPHLASVCVYEHML